MRRFENKVAVITGGAQGIGKATTIKFFNEGASVAIWDIDEEKGNALCNELKSDKNKVEFFKVNVSDFEDVKMNVEKVISSFGKIDILINNAGITRDATLKYLINYLFFLYLLIHKIKKRML